MKQTIIIFGSNGMLGNYMYSYFIKNQHVITITRDKYDILINTYSYLEKLLVSYNINDTFIVLNCIGIIPQRDNTNSSQTYIKINSIFPHILSLICNKYNAHMIHFTTDCVFTGKTGNYNEMDIHDDTSIYSTSKSAGEPYNCTVIRSSIIGEEIYNKHSLLEWAIANKNNIIRGYINHIWNGVTCLQMAKIVDNIISNNKYWIGIRHITSPKAVSKNELLHMINKIYSLNLNIIPYAHDTMCNRSLSTIYGNMFEIPDLSEQILELYNFDLYIF